MQAVSTGRIRCYQKDPGGPYKRYNGTSIPLVQDICRRHIQEQNGRKVNKLRQLSRMIFYLYRVIENGQQGDGSFSFVIVVFGIDADDRIAGG
jgi:hypothetical protein